MEPKIGDIVHVTDKGLKAGTLLLYHGDTLRVFLGFNEDDGPVCWGLYFSRWERFSSAASVSYRVLCVPDD